MSTSTAWPKVKLVDRLDFVLNTKVDLVTSEGWDKDELKDLFSEMIKLCKLVSGVGLAAPQIGISKACIVVLTDQGYIKAVNPLILASRGLRRDSKEGCLSLPQEDYIVKRWSSVKVQYTGLDKKVRFREASGFEAIIWQHEILHLEGELISKGEKVSETGLIKP